MMVHWERGRPHPPSNVTRNADEAGEAARAPFRWLGIDGATYKTRGYWCFISVTKHPGTLDLRPWLQLLIIAALAVLCSCRQLPQKPTPPAALTDQQVAVLNAL